MKLLCGELRLTWDAKPPPDVSFDDFAIDGLQAGARGEIVGCQVDYNDPYSLIVSFWVVEP